MKQGQGSVNVKRRIALGAVFAIVILSILTFRFVQDVKTQLWEQSIDTIMESTRQGCKTLEVQLGETYESMETAAAHLEDLSLRQSEQLDDALEDYVKLEEGILLYMEDGTVFPNSAQLDNQIVELLSDGEKGIVNPHISTVTGVNVFDLYVKVTLKDGSQGYLLKEYEVESIVDSFSLSFYNNAGFSYVLDAQGDVLIRSPHPGSNKTMKNLFDMLSRSQNSEGSLRTFQSALQEGKTGWAVFSYEEQPTVFCYTPLNLQSDWYLISIIPKEVVSAQTNHILKQSLGLTGAIIFVIVTLVLLYLWYINKTSKKLRNQTQYIGHLYNSIPEGIALITITEPYQFIQLNDEGLRILRYPEDAVNDTPKGEMLEAVFCQDDFAEMSEILQEISFDDEKHVFEQRMVRLDGSQFWASGIVEKTQDEDGKPILIATFHDITAEKLAEEEIEREKLVERVTLVGAISNAFPVIISINLTKDTVRFIYLDEDLMENLGNQQTYSQLAADISHTVHPANLEKFKDRFSLNELFNSLEDGKKEVSFEAQFKLKDDAYHWIATQIIHVDNPYSQDKMAILISRGIDERKHEEEQQRQALETALENARTASESKGQFLSNMSHDIRTPMNAIVGMTAIASAHINDPQRVQNSLEKIELSSKHLLNLINDVLDMSKIESGKMSLKEEPLDLLKELEESFDLIKIQAKAKSLDLQADLSAVKDVYVVGDAVRLQQVWVNIMSNAVKYTEPGGSISIQVRQENGTWRGYENYVFRCADTGIGMSQQFLERLFLPFERVQDSTSSKIAGTGLGMAITKNIIDLMNGNIQVESRLSEGSVFTVTLPLKLQERAEKDCSEYETTQTVLAGKRDYSDKRVLLVEDNEINREIAREMLSESGIMIEEACDGEEAVQKVAEGQEGYYDLILMDIQMPKMDGYEASKRIRAMDRDDTREVPIIAMTANAFSEDVQAALQAGMNAHFAKPVDMNVLQQMLDEYLNKSSR